MDLSKRLANLDRLTKKNVVKGSAKKSSPSHSPEQKALSAEKGLIELGLRPSRETPWSVWEINYSEDMPLAVGVIPPLHGFFTRASEAHPEPENILFLDTETTGLSGGTGTIAFLVGVGWISGDQFISRQYFIPDFAHETSMLEELAQLADRFDVVMTFNGASFDLPLLRTRSLMNRLNDPCRNLISWDLLVPGRRLWGKHFPNCRQQTLEKGLLEMKRGADDIDGSLIPQTWFDFINDGDGSVMARVLHHNQKDLLGMVGIFSRVLDMATLMHDYHRSADHWLQAWALGRVAEKARQQEMASAWMLHAVQSDSINPDGGFGCAPFVKDAIRLLKRQKHWLSVEEVIKQAQFCGLDNAWLHREAAILFEHRLHNPEKALRHAKLCDEPERVQRIEKKMQ